MLQLDSHLNNPTARDGPILVSISELSAHFSVSAASVSAIKKSCRYSFQQYRYRQCRHIGIGQYRHIGVSAKIWYRPTPTNSPERVREYIGCTTNSTPPRGWGVLLKCTFLMSGVPSGVPCPTPHIHHTTCTTPKLQVYCSWHTSASSCTPGLALGVYIKIIQTLTRYWWFTQNK